MGYIREPEGVDFEVINKKMTPEEKLFLSQFIAKRKEEIKGLEAKKLHRVRLKEKSLVSLS